MTRGGSRWASPTNLCNRLPQTDPSPGVLKKAVAASAIGNATEWFDYGIYAYGVTYISAAIFPGDTQSATLLALMTFAVSFLVRPLGGLVWGRWATGSGAAGAGHHHPDDVRRHAVRRPCPVLRRDRVLGPVLMVLLRMIQGFSTGGEYGGAATFMAEYAPCRRRGFLGSFLEFGTLAGFSLGALLMLGFSLVLNDEQMGAWGWRLPFLVAAPLGLVGVYLRSRLEDTPIFRELAESGERRRTHRPSSRICCCGYWRPILRLGGLVVALNVVNYTLLSYMPTYLEQSIGLSSNMSLLVPIIGMLAMMVFLPFAGSSRTGWAQTDVVVLADRSFRCGRADVHADGHRRRRRDDRVRGPRPALCAPARDDLGDLPRHVPDSCALCRIRHRLQRVDVDLRWHRARGERLAGQFDRRQPRARVLHDGGVCHRRDRAVKVPETTRCPIDGTECPGTAAAPPQLDYQKEPSRV